MTPSESEARRLMFIEERDGLSAALGLAKRTPRICRKAVLNPKQLRVNAVLPVLVHRVLSVPEAVRVLQIPRTRPVRQ